MRHSFGNHFAGIIVDRHNCKDYHFHHSIIGSTAITHHNLTIPVFALKLHLVSAPLLPELLILWPC